MKRSIILLGALVVSSLAYSQVGINNESPKATLDITGKPTDTSVTDGLLAPRIAGDELKLKDTLYGTNQTGALIYATSAITFTPLSTDKTKNVTAAGYYYFDGSYWQKVAAGNFWGLTGNAGTNPAPSGTNFLGTTDAKDFQIMVGGTTLAKNNIMRAKASNGHVMFGNLLDVGATPNVQDPDRFVNIISGTVASQQSNFAVQNTIGEPEFLATGTIVTGARFANAVSGVSTTSKGFYGASFDNKLASGLSGSIKGINNTLVLGNNQTYAASGATTIAGMLSTAQVLNGSTANVASGGVQGGFIGLDFVASNFGTIDGNVFGTKSQIVGTGAFTSTTANISGIVSYLNPLGNIAAGNTMGVYSIIEGGLYASGAKQIALRSEINANTATNGYGLYIDDIKGTESQHGIYQLGTNDANNLAGDTMIGDVTTPTNQLHVKDTANPVRFEGLQTAAATDNIVTTDSNGVLKKTTTALSAVDVTNDIWVNNAGSARVELGTKADGTTARDANTNVVITDEGRVGIKENNPSDDLQLGTGSMRIDNPDATDNGIKFSGAGGIYHRPGTNLGISGSGNYISMNSSSIGVALETSNSDPTKDGLLMLRNSTGNVGINVADPADYLHIHSTRSGAFGPTGGIRLTNSVNASVVDILQGHLDLTRTDSFAGHIGGYIDFRGSTSASAYRISKFYNGSIDALTLNSDQTENGPASIPFFLHRNGQLSLAGPAIAQNNIGQSINAVLNVNGMASAVGWSAKHGALGDYTGNSFNVAWDGTNAGLYIDATFLGNWSFTSDYRLKKNVNNNATNAVDRVMKLRPVTFEYKDVQNDIFTSDKKVHEGFIAHELQQVIPDAVNGVKDALTAEGKIQPQTLNPMPVISILTKAIQEQQKQIEELKRKIEALEKK